MKYSVDWFTKNIPVWEQTLAQFKGKPIRAIELGSYEGRSAEWLLENILTHPDASLVCVDSWKDNIFFSQPDISVDWKDVRAKFNANTKRFGKKVEVYDGRTKTYLLSGVAEKADLIYVDASHTAGDCLIDGVLAHLLLKPGGVIIFDDYLWAGLEHNTHVPMGAINAFMECFAGEYEALALGYQVTLKKKNETQSK